MYEYNDYWGGGSQLRCLCAAWKSAIVLLEIILKQMKAVKDSAQIYHSYWLPLYNDLLQSRTTLFWAVIIDLKTVRFMIV